jgi:hypothetical protein
VLIKVGTDLLTRDPALTRYQFEPEGATDRILAYGGRIAHIVVRACGFVLLTVGLWIALAVIGEAWSLYQSPDHIERFAVAIENGSHLDHALASASATPDIEGESASPSRATSAPAFRLTYFVAWVIAILLLMLIGRLAIAAVKTGGELVLYDLHIKRFVRELLRESKSP